MVPIIKCAAESLSTKNILKERTHYPYVLICVFSDFWPKIKVFKKRNFKCYTNLFLFVEILESPFLSFGIFRKHKEKCKLNFLTKHFRKSSFWTLDIFKKFPLIKIYSHIRFKLCMLKGVRTDFEQILQKSI